MAAKKPIAKVPIAVPVKKAAPAKAEVKKPAGPTARTCPLVMDGEVDAEDFSEADCLRCSEFDCRYCESGHGSGALRSRLFAAGDDADGEDAEDVDDGWGGDLDAEGDGFGAEADDGDEDDGL